MEAKMVIHDFEDLNTGVLEHTIFCIILEITPSLKDSSIGTVKQVPSLSLDLHLM